MTDITDVEAVRFCNEHARIVADKIAGAQGALSGFLSLWAVKDLASKIPNDSSVIIDGSASDGRTQITGADIHALISGAQTIKDSIDANSGAIGVNALKIAVNPKV